MNTDEHNEDDDRVATSMRRMTWRSIGTAKDVILWSGELSQVLHEELRRECSEANLTATRIAGVLMRSLRHEDVDVRRGAAQLLGEAAQAFIGPWDGSNQLNAKNLQDIVEALVSSMVDVDPCVRFVAVKALSCREYRQAFATRIVRGVIKRLFEDPCSIAKEEALVIEALRLILNCGSDAAAEAVTAISKLLEHPSVPVQVNACLTLKYLRDEATSAVNTLVNVAASKGPDEVRHEALAALAVLDADGLAVMALVRNEHERRELLELLADLGEAGRRLRQTLNVCWFPPPLLSPAYDKTLRSNVIECPSDPMTCTQLVKKIYPGNQRASDSETVRRRVRDWMHEGKLPAKSIGRGKNTKYVVDQSTLKELADRESKNRDFPPA